MPPYDWKIFLHHDRLYYPDQWHVRFGHLLTEVHRIPCVAIDLLQPESRALIERAGPRDGLIGRFGHIPVDLQTIRPLYAQLHERFGGRIFPNDIVYRYYDDKRAQAEFFRSRGYPSPLTAWVESEADLARFLRESGLRFPLVVKASEGAGSTNVRLAGEASEVGYPCLVQEFCAGNDGDVRINVIGHRVMGFHRRNREGDFRASGSGVLNYPDRLDPHVVELAYRISHDNGFDSMAYDFVQRDGRWVVLEMSYTYVDTAVRDCAAYYDMRTGSIVGKPGVYPEDFILEDFLARHYPEFASSIRRVRTRC